ncbi:hypothetical protein KAX08_08790 [candidate division WOR-3 bacterium]|nr:hypothetical protein [candidate division WOR-3 bacterium]
MTEINTGVGMIVRNANKRKIDERFLYPILKISKEEAKKMYPSKYKDKIRQSEGTA